VVTLGSADVDMSKNLGYGFDFNFLRTVETGSCSYDCTTLARNAFVSTKACKSSARQHSSATWNPRR
jgi:hypothetical protein